MKASVYPVSRLVGRPVLPPDKSIAHRAALFAALADGRSIIRNYPAAADPQSTLSVLRSLGVPIEESGGRLSVTGMGRSGWIPPSDPLDCGNSGTTMRLLAGILAGQSFDTVLVGDDSLSRRPMGRIANPLRQMGARLELTDGHAPIRIQGGASLEGIRYELPVASAQVKSCVLLAGLYADGPTQVVESLPTRDHTERMLGLDVTMEGALRVITVRPDFAPAARDVTIPADFSAAAFFLVAGTIVEDADLLLEGVGLNPTRSALLDVLREMGADIDVLNERSESGEPIADLRVRSARLTGIDLDPALVPNLIDEIPVLAIAAAFAEGKSVLRGAEELRVKETDRIAAMAGTLDAFGCRVEEMEDGLEIQGGSRLTGAAVVSHGDHRIAMAAGVAALVAHGRTEILGAECAAVSFPGFWTELEALGVSVRQESSPGSHR
jgi:3-phosphoshikimate 1-carboxyvinyltransferase